MHCVAAEPYEFTCQPSAVTLVIIDMHQDFLEPGGFGEALRNDGGLLRSAIGPAKRVLKACRAAGMTVMHTREGHRADLSDLAPAKRMRGRFTTSIGDPGPIGRLPVRGEEGHDIGPELAPEPGGLVVDKPGKGTFFATDLEPMLRWFGIAQLFVCGVTTEVCVNTTVRDAGGLHRLVLPRIPEGRDRDDRGAGRHPQLGRRVNCAARRTGMNRRTR